MGDKMKKVFRVDFDGNVLAKIAVDKDGNISVIACIDGYGKPIIKTVVEDITEEELDNDN